MFQNWDQKGPKMLGRNWENRLGDHFGDLKRAWWSQGRLHKASSCLFWPPFHRIWTSVSISCSCSGITANVDLQSSSHSSINELCCPQLVYQTLEHTVGFDVHHSLFTISDHTLVRCRCFQNQITKSPNYLPSVADVAACRKLVIPPSKSTNIKGVGGLAWASWLYIYIYICICMLYIYILKWSCHAAWAQIPINSVLWPDYSHLKVMILDGRSQLFRK